MGFFRPLRITPCALGSRFYSMPCPMLYALCRSLEVLMPAIASLEDLKAAQKDLLEAKDLDDLKTAFKKWRRIGWKNICKLWLEERSPEQLKGERGQ